MIVSTENGARNSHPVVHYAFTVQLHSISQKFTVWQVLPRQFCGVSNDRVLQPQDGILSELDRGYSYTCIKGPYPKL